MGNHWKSLSSFHASLKASLCLLNADACTRPVADLMHAFCGMEMRFLLLKPSRYRIASRPVGSTQLCWIQLDLSGLLSISFFVRHSFPCCHCADKLKGLPWQPQTSTKDNTVMWRVCRQQPKNPFILCSGASLVLEHVFRWAEHYKSFHILLTVKP